MLQQPQPMSPQHEQFSHVFFDLAISLASSRVSGSLIDFVSGQIHMLMVPEQTKIAPITANGATFKKCIIEFSLFYSTDKLHTGLYTSSMAIIGDNMDPILAKDDAKLRAFVLTTVGMISFVKE